MFLKVPTFRLNLQPPSGESEKIIRDMEKDFIRGQNTPAQGRIVLSSRKSAHADWNWPISREKYLKID